MSSQVNVTKSTATPWLAATGLPSSEFGVASPFSLWRRFTDEMDRVFTMGRSRGELDLWAPALEVAERDGKFVVTAELPGLKKEEISIEIGNDALVLQGQRKRTHHERHEGLYQSERSYGRFYRSISLPEGAEVDKAQAQFSDGVLEVSIPIPESKNMRRQIMIQEAKPKVAAH